MRRLTLGLVLPALLMVAGRPAAAAQEQVTILNNGATAPNVEVSVVNRGAREALGAGLLSQWLTQKSPGTEVKVHRRRSGGLILIAEGEQLPPEDRDAEPIGAFRVGQRVVIDVGRGSVALASSAAAAQSTNAAIRRFDVSFKAGITYLRTDFAEKAFDAFSTSFSQFNPEQPVGERGASGITAGLSVDWNLTRRTAVTFGGGYLNTGTFAYEHVATAQFPSQQQKVFNRAQSEVKIWYADVGAKVRFEGVDVGVAWRPFRLLGQSQFEDERQVNGVRVAGQTIEHSRNESQKASVAVTAGMRIWGRLSGEIEYWRAATNKFSPKPNPARASEEVDSDAVSVRLSVLLGPSSRF